ncbi:MAG: epoxyqueuosine reductase, partial [Lachnospiraceae bacterium]|nr:epoxyqueuosine reductase [Lachnospiraceae bacterium]
ESRCPEECTKCVDICPHKALKGRTWDIGKLRSDLIDYHLCNRKRSDYIEKHGRKNACGLCMVVCPKG